MKIPRFASTILRRLFPKYPSDPRRRFRRIYEKNLFGGKESRSGPGSSMEQTQVLRKELRALLERLAVNSLLDAPCGDCNWMRAADLGAVTYTGVDIVPELIEANRTRFASRGIRFMVADLSRDPLPRADLIFCRDCLVHLPFEQIRACLVNFLESGATYLMATTFTATQLNQDLEPGAIWRPLNMERAPFCFPPPEYLLFEQCTEDSGRYPDKSMGVWRLSDLKPLR